MGSADSQFDNHVGQPTVRPSRGGFAASADVSWTFSEDRSSSTVTRPEWPNMSATDRAAVDRYMEGLRAHEEGHHRVARDFVRNASRTVSARGSTREEAMRHLQEALDRHQQRTQAALDARNAQYDRLTRRGANQRAAGGPNAVLNCP
jgi:hypothetical protein